jgi:hypothetical protein
VLFQHRPYTARVSDITLLEGPPFDGPSIAFRQIVENNRRKPPAGKKLASMASYISGPACDKNFHNSGATCASTIMSASWHSIPRRSISGRLGYGKAFTLRWAQLDA